MPTRSQLLCKTKINQLDVALRIQEDVLGLHVSICHALDIVEKFEDKDHFGGVEKGCLLVELFGSSKVCKNLPAGAVFKLT